MSPRLACFIGCRYILSRKGSRFISLTSLISMGGLVLGVLALIIVLSVFNGSQGIMRDRTLITVPHGAIQADAGFTQWREARAILARMPAIRATAPFIDSEAMVSRQGNHQIARIRGIDPAAEQQIASIAPHIQSGSLELLVPGQRRAIVARQLAASLRVEPGDSINLVLPTLAGDGRNFDLDMHRFTVAGIFDARFTIGANLAYVHLEDSADFMGLDNVDSALQLRLEVDQVRQAAGIVESALALLREHFPDHEFSGMDWSQREASLFNALKLEKVMTTFMLMMIVAVGAFNIVSTLVMIVADKQPDIAILRTMGAGNGTIMGIFIVQGFLTGLVGTLTGTVLGVATVFNFDRISAFIQRLTTPDDMFIISSLPAVLQWSDVLLICGCALLISFLATLYPAWKAARIQPAEILRYE